MARPLRGAYARLTRANVHLRDFKRRAERFNRSHLDHLSYDFNPQTQLAHVHWDKGREPSAGMSIVVGETIYNLRAALDYLVYELARRDSRSEQNGTQFPIESTPEGFERRCDETRDRGVFLRGLLPEHKAAIKILQPCCGCNWTKLLADLSNPDKHRKLTDSPGTATFHTHIAYGPVGRPPIAAVHPLSKVFPAQGRLRGKVWDVYVHTDATLQVEFGDGTLVSETLDLLQSEVAATLAAFEPCFKGGCSH